MEQPTHPLMSPNWLPSSWLRRQYPPQYPYIILTDSKISFDHAKKTCNKTQSHPANTFDKSSHHSVAHYLYAYKKPIRYKQLTHNKPSLQIISKTSKKSKTTSSHKYAISQPAPRASETHNYTSIKPLRESTSKSNLTNSAQEEIP